MIRMVTVPWVTTVIDPLGKEEEISVDRSISADDIWLWCKFYKQNTQNVESKPKAKPASKQEPNKRKSTSIEGQVRKGLGHRLTCIFNHKGSNRSVLISKCVGMLKSRDKELIDILLLYFRDRLREVAHLEEIDPVDKKYLLDLVGKEKLL